MYELISAKKTVRALYAEQLAAKGRVSAAVSQQLFDAAVAEYADAFARSKSQSVVRDPDHGHGLWA
jgi:2-oxoglutarate dehydrogenase complex dehydrogenase (E1) component-like enzyme